MSVMRGAAVQAAFALLATAVLCSLPTGAGAEPITLRLHNFNSPKAIANRLFMQPWAEEIERKSEGRVAVQVFPAMQLGGKPSDLYGQARDGVVDIIWTVPGYSPGRFPLTEVFELPFVAAGAEATSQALTEFYRKWMRDEYEDTHPLVFHATAPTHVHTTRKPIRTLEDFKGLKIRTPSRIGGETLAAFGAIPIGMPIPAVYEALSRGVVEGTAIPWTIMRPFRLHEVTAYHTEVALSCGPVRDDDEQAALRGTAARHQGHHRRQHRNGAGQAARPDVAGRREAGPRDRGRAGSARPVALRSGEGALGAGDPAGRRPLDREGGRPGA